MTTTRDPVFGCVLWDGPKDKDGYGFHGRSRAHIVAYEAEFGPVPEGFELDHLCRRRNCIALHHLEPVTKAENQKRKSWRYRAKRTHCFKGHDMKANRIITNEGGVVCRQCNRDASVSSSPATHPGAAPR